MNLEKQLSDGFKRSVYWNDYQIIPAKVINQGTKIYELLSASFQGVKRLFALAYTIAANAANNEAGIKDNKKYFLPRGKIENYKFYDQPINYLIKQYDEDRKVSTGQGDDYTTWCLLDYAYFKDNCRLIAVDFIKQKALYDDPWAVQQILFQEVVGRVDNTKIRLYTIIEKSKETVLEFYKGKKKLCENI